MNKKKFIYNLDDFQNTAVKELLKYDKVIIKSKKFTGKSFICKKLFDSLNDKTVIYHTGCCPKLFNKAKEELMVLLNDLNEATIILDEFYDDEILDYLCKKDSYKCYIVTNDYKVKKEKFDIFNYYMFYKKFVINEVGKELNIHQVMNKDINYDKKNEYLRRSSKQTIIYIKKDGIVKESKLEI